jgi:Sugar transferases involved in lipopolysaccharide synthesis
MRLVIHKILALILLIISLPILFISIILLKIETPTLSPFFTQRRVGIDGEIFGIFKLRTMRPISKSKLEELETHNEAGEIIFKIKKDPRVTLIGYCLRKLSIDEFPQLINVLKGDMALVGPRPPLIKEVVKYTPVQVQRLQTLPGCTGLWQVSGRSDLSFEEMIKLDLIYLKKQKLSFDLIIILRTVFTVFTMKGAY